jgi:hypothetical protein
MSWAGKVEKINVYRFSAGRPRPLERLLGRFEDNIKTDLKEIEWGVWIEFIKLRIRTSVGLS